MSGKTLRKLRNFLRRTSADNFAAALASFGTQIDDPIRALDHLEIVLDHDERVTGVAQFHQHLQQFFDIGEMQAGRRFVQNVNGATGRLLRQFGREFHPLRFAAGKRRAGLAELQISEPTSSNAFSLSETAGTLRKKRAASSTVMFEHVGDIFAFVGNLECLAIITLAVADLALDINVRQKMHLDFDQAAAFAIFAAPAFDIETEAARHRNRGRAPRAVAQTVRESE